MKGDGPAVLAIVFVPPVLIALFTAFLGLK